MSVKEAPCAQPIGHCGLQLAFTDDHRRGIYPWSNLEGLGA
jgi:DUF971 family protein